MERALLYLALAFGLAASYQGLVYGVLHRLLKRKHPMAIFGRLPSLTDLDRWAHRNLLAGCGLFGLAGLLHWGARPPVILVGIWCCQAYYLLLYYSGWRGLWVHRLRMLSLGTLPIGLLCR